MKTLNCDHRFCIPDLAALILSQIEQGKFKTEDITCPICRAPLEKGADGSIDPNIVIHAISQEQWEKVCQLRINQIPGIIRCPQNTCHGLFEVPKEAISVTCKGCQTTFCSQCLQQPHSGNCQQASIQSAKEAVRKAGMDVRKCPYCGYYATKDQGCQHVKCIQCKKDWTFCCEQKRNPIIAHGNHYHAKGCWCGENWDGQDKMENDCEQCQALGRLCSKPGLINQELIELNRLAKEERDKRDRAR